MTLREELRAHQIATDCSDSRMLNLVCDYLESNKVNLLEFIVEKLERGPSIPLWRTDLFTDAEREVMMENATDEVSDCIREVAQDFLDGEELVDLFGYIDQDSEVMSRILFHWDNPIELKELVEVELGLPAYELHVAFANRFGLIKDHRVTDLGKAYIGRYL